MLFFKSKTDKEAEKLQRLKMSVERMKLKAMKQRMKNSLQTSKANSEIKQISKKVEKLESIGDMKEYIRENFPEQKHWALELLEKPEAQSLLTQFLGGGMPISNREAMIHKVMENPDIQKKLVEMVSNGKKT